jgi:hypothetical protein
MALVSFDKASAGTVTGPCGLSFGLPSFSVSFGTIPADVAAAIAKAEALILAGALPSLNFTFNLQCDPSKPIDIAAGVPYGGGRQATPQPDPTTDDT